MNDTSLPPEEEDEWARRTLCSDESCIGVIGPDGRCKECGRPYDGTWPPAHDADIETVPEAAPEPSSEPVDPPEETPMPEAGPPIEDKAYSDTEPDDHWSHRRLCRDGNCIGVIGPDGRCKECGLPADGDD